MGPYRESSYRESSRGTEMLKTAAGVGVLALAVLMTLVLLVLQIALTPLAAIVALCIRVLPENDEGDALDVIRGWLRMVAWPWNVLDRESKTGSDGA